MLHQPSSLRERYSTCSAPSAICLRLSPPLLPAVAAPADCGSCPSGELCPGALTQSRPPADDTCSRACRTPGQTQDLLPPPPPGGGRTAGVKCNREGRGLMRGGGGRHGTILAMTGCSASAVGRLLAGCVLDGRGGGGEAPASACPRFSVVSRNRRGLCKALGCHVQ